MKYLVLLMLVFTLSCQGQAEKAMQHSTENKVQPILIVYTSRTNNTRALARMLQKKTGGNMTAIELQDPYPENYQKIVAQVAEENEAGFLPPLQTKINNLDHYDTVFYRVSHLGNATPTTYKKFFDRI